MSKLKALGGVDYTQNKPNTPNTCCGMTYREVEKAPKTAPRSSGKGIAVYEGAFGENKTAYKTERTIVQCVGCVWFVFVRFKE